MEPAKFSPGNTPVTRSIAVAPSNLSNVPGLPGRVSTPAWLAGYRKELLNQYVEENDLDTEYVDSPKAEAEITRQRTEYNIDTSTPTGQALDDAIDAEAIAKGAHFVADDTWREHEAQRAVQPQLEDLQARLGALGLGIERMQAQLDTNCK